MKRKVSAVLLAVILLLVSCGKKFDYEIYVGEQIVLDFQSSGPGTGFAWHWDKHDDILDTISHVFSPYDENFSGNPGIERWTFVGKRKGLTTIRMVYKRSWEIGIEDSREYSVKVL